MNAERLAELMKLGLIQRKKVMLAALGSVLSYREDRVLQYATEVEELDALLRSDLVKRAREILEAVR